MNKTVDYCIEHKVKGEVYYRKTFIGFKDKELALKLAKASAEANKGTKILKTRVVRQERKVIKVINTENKKGP